MDDDCEYSMAGPGPDTNLGEVNCEPCSKQGTTVHAEEYCLDCQLYLCDGCYTDHQNQASSRGHLYCILQDEDETDNPARVEGPSGSTGSLQDLETKPRDLESEKCLEHFEKFFEYFCEPCQQLCCSECVTGPHNRCQDVKNILDIVISKKGKMDEEFEAIDNELAKLAREKIQFDNTIASNCKAAASRRMRALRELKAAREEINQQFDALEKKMEKEIEKVEKEDRESIRLAAEQEKLLQKDTEQVKADVLALRKGKIRREQFIAMTLTLDQINDIRNKRENFRKEGRIRFYNFNLSHDVRTIVKNIQRLGKLNFRDPQLKVMVKMEAEVRVCSTSFKKKPLIVGLTEVSEHFLVLLDAEVDESGARPNFLNNSVIVIDLMKNEVTCEVTLETSVFGMTTVKRNQIAITLKVEKKIQLMMVMDSGSLVKGRQIDAGGECIGIVCSGEDLIVSYVDKIQILNRKGEVLKKIDFLNGFEYPDSLALSPDQETIYVSDMNMNSLTSMTFDGKVKVTYKDVDLKFPSTVTVDKDGSVYVCSTGSLSIQQLTEDCCKVQTLDVAAASITFSSKGDKLYVGLLDKVQIYRVTKPEHEDLSNITWCLGADS